MKFALLGIDPEALRLVRAIAQHTTHQLTWFSFATESGEPAGSLDDPTLHDEVRRAAPWAEESADWTQLFGSGVADAVIVAGRPGGTGRFSQLRRLVQEQVPVVVTHPITFSVLEAYELEAVRDESRGVVVPLLPLRWFGKTRWLAQFVRSAEHSGSTRGIGRIEQIVWQCREADRARGAVLGRFARDVDFVRAMCGEITQVAALGPPSAVTPGARPTLAALGVQMTGPAGVLVRWSIEQPTDEAGSLITIVGSSGRMTLDIDEAKDPGDWPIDRVAGRDEPYATQAREEVSGPTDVAELVAARVADALAGRVVAGEPTWSDVTRSLELVEALEKSLRKGRTVALSYEGRGETNAFKGTMASLGCSLLVLGLVLIVVAAVVLKIAEKTGHPWLVEIAGRWPAALLVLLSLFLLLQLLRFVIPRDTRKDDANDEPADEAGVERPKD